MITFIDYQYRGIGGVGQLVVNTTLELNKRGKKTKLYCSKKSYEYKCLEEKSADFEFINSDEVSKKQLLEYLAPEDVIVLTHIGETELLEEIKPLNNRILFYSVFPDTFFVYQPALNFLLGQKTAALDFIKTLYDNDALLIMDGPNLKAIYDRGGAELYNISYLPVPVMNYLGQHRNNRPSGDTKITYLGRGNDEWKIYPVIKVLEDMNKESVQTILTIITDSNTMFEDMIKKYVPQSTIKIEFINNLHGEELEKYLLENSTLHIAMGTSALEGAKLGIPTILVDYSKQKFPDNYKYRWMYQCVDYCLGGEIKDGVLPYDIGSSLKNVWQSLSTEEGYKKESEFCRKYIEENHSMSYFVGRLVKASEQTKMTTQMYCNTKFSRNLYRYHRSFVRNVASKVKRALFGNKYDI